jgi:hypothetical protein
MVDQGSVELLLTRYVPSSVPVHAVADDANLAALFVDLLGDRLSACGRWPAPTDAQMRLLMTMRGGEIEEPVMLMRDLAAVGHTEQ